jgi:predicted acyl esterase
MSNIEVPLLSVANWGGILLHLRGNVHGFLGAGSKLKYLRFITGRHDLPFYEDEGVELQRSFLDAFMRGEDRAGWTTGQASRVEITLRKGDVGFNDSIAERQYEHRTEDAWPIPRTQYTKYYLDPAGTLTTKLGKEIEETSVSYKAPANLKGPEFAHFITEAFTHETEITGHIVAHFEMSVSVLEGEQTTPSELDVFVTIRHLGANSKEILYTGTVGDPVPVTKGWLRASLRKTSENDRRHKPWYPHREYKSTDVLPVRAGEVYGMDIEIWPTNVVVSPGHRLLLEVSSGDTQGAGLFEHNSITDRPPERLRGNNHIHFGPEYENWLLLPIVPARQS